MSFDNNLWLMHGDCLERMKEIPDGSVDAVICDPPYGTTACKWDAVIPLDAMWEQLKRVIKPHGAIVMTASQPFTTTLIASNMPMFKYCWVWEKNMVSGVAQAKNKPITKHEDIVVFSDGVTVHASQTTKRMTYNPQGLLACNKVLQNRAGTTIRAGGVASRPSHQQTYTQTQTNYPTSVVQFDCERGLHPTQKPVALMEYLIKTYTNEGETVLDFTIGSGSTGVAALNCGRKFIGIERDDAYFEIAQRRIEDSRGLFK